MDLIRIKDVKKTYKTGTTAIYDLDLNIKKGEFDKKYRNQIENIK